VNDSDKLPPDADLPQRSPAISPPGVRIEGVREAACKGELVGSYQALHDAYRQRETVFAPPWPTAVARRESQSPPRDARITVVRQAKG